MSTAVKMNTGVASHLFIKVLLVASLWTLAAGQILEANFDWGATYCGAQWLTTCPDATPISAFTMDSMKLDSCPSKSSEAFNLKSIPPATLEVMTCAWKAGTGSTENLWGNQVWQSVGKCTGLGLSNYFKTFTDLYQKYNINKVLYDNKLGPPSINGASLRDAVQRSFGVTPLIKCNKDTPGSLDSVAMCFNRDSLTPINCSGQKPECLGQLNMIEGQIAISSECTKYIPYTYKSAPVSPTVSPPVVPPVTPSSPVNPPISPSPNAVINGSPVNKPPPPATESSSSDTGLIVGIVVGVIAAIAIIAGLALYFMRKKKKENSAEAADDPLNKWPSTMQTNGSAPTSAYSGGSGAGMAGAAAVAGMGAAGAAAYGANGQQTDYMLATSPPMGPGYQQQGSMYNPALPSYPPQSPSGQGYNQAPILPNLLGGPTSPTARSATSQGLDGFTVSNVSQDQTRSISGSLPPGALLSNDPLLAYVNSRLAISEGGRSDSSDLSNCQIRFQDIQLEQPIGEGSWGRVYKGTWNHTPVAVKVLLDGSGHAVTDSGTAEAALSASNPVLARLQSEAGLMASLRHPAIVQFLGVCTFPASVVTEFCSRGSLFEVIRGAVNDPAKAKELTWSLRLSMLQDACKGMLYLHEKTPPIIHRDLKSPNLLVTQSWNVKVADFNLSKLLSDSSKSTSLAAMNPRWLAPEILQGESATAACDVYAFGVIMWEVLSWQLPWGTQNPWSIVSRVLGGGRLEIPARADLPGPNSSKFSGLDDYITLMTKCWAQNPYDRPTFGQVVTELRALEART